MSDKPKITEGPVSVSVDRVEAIEKQAKFIKRLTNPSPLIEYTEYEKLKAENERLMRERDSYAGYAKLNDELMEERDALKAKLAEVEAELKKAQGIAWDRKCELRKEREAANVIREALEQLSRGRFSFGDMCEIIREALTKADEIRGGE